MKLKGTLGFLGYGNMGAAILGGLIKTGTLPADRGLVYDADPAKRAQAGELDVTVAASAEELARGSDTLVLAVKPQSMAEALGPLKAGLSTKTLIVSIAAGISIGYLEDSLGKDMRVVRTMPNTPALVGAGAAAFAMNANCTDADGETGRAIFEAIGIVEIVPAEEDIDVVTALSGSGPAYFFYMVECLVEAAVAHGLDEAQATRLAAQTALGAGLLLRDSGEPPSVLREKVTSKGGTTAAALDAFKAGGFAELIAAGVDAAVARSKELGK